MLGGSKFMIDKTNHDVGTDWRKFVKPNGSLWTKFGVTSLTELLLYRAQPLEASIHKF
jgi:hypothetical protein